jgi:NAD(P)-dependent dehydrogenase (short-subunit alcohol dehydrogenase family)
VQALLRDDLLAGREVLAAPRTAATAACERLGAGVTAVEADLLLDEAAVEAAVRPCGALVVDARALFGAGGPEALRRALDGTWCVVRATANAAFIPERRGGKVVLVAPSPGAGAHAEALRAGLENLARTSSIEWSQYGITPTALRPGPAATEDEVAELVAYLVSPAGDYFSGCALDLG